MNTKLTILILEISTMFLGACSPKIRMTAFPAATEAPPLEATIFVEIPGTQVSYVEGGGAYPSSVDSSLPIPSVANQMIIKDAQIELLVENTDQTLERITTMVKDEGGYIISARSWLENDFKRAEIRIGVPSMNFENTLTYLRHLGLKVLNETLSGQDVSSQYTDLKSRLANLEATAARVREFLDEARTVEESLRVNQTLSDLEGQIEQIKGQMKYLEGRSAYSTITLAITPQMPTPTLTLTPTPGPGWNPGNTVRQASEVMVKIFQGTIDTLIWLVMLAWPLVLIAVIVWLVFKRLRRNRSKKNSGDES